MYIQVIRVTQSLIYAFAKKKEKKTEQQTEQIQNLLVSILVFVYDSYLC